MSARVPRAPSLAALGLAAGLLLTLPACHHDGNAVLLVVVTASGTPPSIAALEVKLNGPGGPSPTNRYAHDDGSPIAFPTTLSASLAAYATGTLTIEVDAEDTSGAIVASGREAAVVIHPGEHKAVYVPLDCGGDACVVDGGVGGTDGAMPPPGPRCGNGRVDQGETCDTAIAAGDPGACPASCDDHIGCTTDTMTGSDCMVQCLHTPIVTPRTGDDCCPPQAESKDDSDCSRSCGNGVVDRGETCDTAIAAGAPGACPTEADCAADTPCATALLLSAGTCSAVCARYPIVAQLGGDGCCPPGAAHAYDSDCPIVCGDGIVDGDETCDTGIAPGRPGACPTTCPSDPFTVGFVSGLGCHASCVSTPITQPISGDGYCPMDATTGHALATEATDTDCAPVCGNGVIERGETCDGPSCPTSCPATPSACLRPQLVGSPATCDVHCVVTQLSTCSLAKDGCCPPGCDATNDVDCSPYCMDGVIETTAGEVCDLAVPPGRPDACPLTCADTKACTRDVLVSAGTCAATCLFLPINYFLPGDGCCAFGAGANFLLDPDCTPVCGNGVVESPAETCDYAIPGSCPTDVSACPPAVGCNRYVVQGTLKECSAHCVPRPITACADGDGCCPSGCSASDDGDCTAVCGDGVVEEGETCDRAITAGKPGACPRSCDDHDACTQDLASGSSDACTAACVHQPITACLTGKNDGCCPAGCAAGTDADCAARCGDGQVGAGETCDPPSACPTGCPDDGDPCTVERLTGSAATCDVACLHVPNTACSGGAPDACCPTGCTPANDVDCL